MIEGNLLVLNEQLQEAGNFAGAASIDTYTFETNPTLKGILLCCKIYSTTTQKNTLKIHLYQS
ncbi:hypothetical protein CON42_15895 [Bacillus thuringiensis]|nr:hypothetical protein CON42_15895 [Bacillus thuringiensis]